jgi:molybdate transport system substrate-binding protein
MKAVTILVMLVAALIMDALAFRAAADEIRVAVASNFADTIRVLARHFEARTGHKVSLVFGATGRHYAQIRNGAPFDVFFAADVRRPFLLEREGLAIAGHRFTYAIGKVVLWSPRAGLVDSHAKVLESGRFRFLAIANPKLAPYGRAARQILEKRGVWERLRGRMVRGENAGQTYNFVKSGNADLGFVAYSYVRRPGKPAGGSSWLPPQALYDPIKQQAVLLRDREAARAFLDFVRGKKARMIIGRFGYGVMDAE